MIPDQSQASAGCSPGGSTNRQAYWYDRMMFPGGLGSGPGSSSGSSGSISGGFGSSTHSASKAIIRAASSLSISFGSGRRVSVFTAPIDALFLEVKLSFVFSDLRPLRPPAFSHFAGGDRTPCRTWGCTTRESFADCVALAERVRGVFFLKMGLFAPKLLYRHFSFP